ncbi:hypothetical protein GIB67_021138 [Kingdonia uniflora]|uniref:Uncharacterized protein n=1 Tax=Kingdonia uniflora TaxID=39325 RepID=A0A7J7N6Y7_9MAGN|nr:hypothetical protein GIB67_021138 [Kingdonia uniflora]
MLYSTLCLIALGSGGVRGSLPALGADQFNPKDPKEKKALARYFNYLLLSITAGACFGVTLIAYYSVYKSWAVGFLISMIGVCLAFIFVVLGRPFYRVVPFGDSPIITITKVIVAAFRNRKLVFPENHNELYEVSDKELSFDQEKIPPTDQFRCLGKASIIRENSTPEPWTVCTVTQVEEVKILTRMLPIIFSTVIMNTCLAQLQTFSVQQGYIMQLTVGKFDVPPTAIPVIPLFFMSILVPIYEFLFIPFARKYTKHPNGISQLQRVGVGLVLSIVSMTVAGLVEVKRRNHANSHPPEKISLLWLSFQYGIFGIADMFTLVGLLDFFYQEAPSGMKSLSTSFTFLSLSLGYYLSGVFVDIINAITERVTENKKGWLHGNNLNTNNVNLFYWFLAILSCLNFANYLYWASWYKYKNVDLDFKPKLKASNESPLRKEEETNEGVEERRISASSPEYKEIIKVKGEKTEESQVGEALKHIKNQS